VGRGPGEVVVAQNPVAAVQRAFKFLTLQESRLRLNFESKI
jgi:hypothetical protein